MDEKSIKQIDLDSKILYPNIHSHLDSWLKWPEKGPKAQIHFKFSFESPLLPCFLSKFAPFVLIFLHLLVLPLFFLVQSFQFSFFITEGKKNKNTDKEQFMIPDKTLPNPSSIHLCLPFYANYSCMTGFLQHLVPFLIISSDHVPL